MPGSMLSFRTGTVTVLLIAISLSGVWRFRRSVSTGGLADTITLADAGQPIEIVVHGLDFSWRFLSPGPDGISDTNDDLFWYHQLVLPPHTPVDFILRSDDYIYTFAPGNLKGVAIPGLENTVHFETQAAGSYPLEVDPLCGYRPYNDDIMGVILVDPALRPGEVHEGGRVAGPD